MIPLSSLPNKPWFRITEAATYLGVSRMTIYNMCADGRLECIGPRFLRKVSRLSLEQMLSKVSTPCC